MLNWCGGAADTLLNVNCSTTRFFKWFYWRRDSNTIQSNWNCFHNTDCALTHSWSHCPFPFCYKHWLSHYKEPFTQNELANNKIAPYFCITHCLTKRFETVEWVVVLQPAHSTHYWESLHSFILLPKSVRIFMVFPESIKLVGFTKGGRGGEGGSVCWSTLKRFIAM